MEQATQTSPATRFDSRLWGLLLLLCGVLFLDGMDVSMVAVALPNIGHELGLSPARCSGSSAATCSAMAGCCCSAGARPI